MLSPVLKRLFQNMKETVSHCQTASFTTPNGLFHNVLKHHQTAKQCSLYAAESNPVEVFLR